MWQGWLASGHVPPMGHQLLVGQDDRRLKEGVEVTLITERQSREEHLMVSPDFVQLSAESEIVVVGEPRHPE